MKKILVVEDDKDISRAMSIRLTGAGYHVVTAEDAVLAATIAAKHHPDVAILDVSLPGGDGFEVAERIQAVLGRLPMIFVTASKQPELPHKAREFGAVAFLEKPYDAKCLLACVKTALDHGAPVVSPA